MLSLVLPYGRLQYCSYFLRDHLFKRDVFKSADRFHELQTSSLTTTSTLNFDLCRFSLQIIVHVESGDLGAGPRGKRMHILNELCNQEVRKVRELFHKDIRKNIFFTTFFKKTLFCILYVCSP